MWASARNALEDHLIIDTIVVAFLSVFHALLGLVILEYLVSDLLAVIVLY
jgi:hypothetical protein